MDNEALKRELYSSVVMHPYSEFKDSLCHWGILGMKWGIRRYQNKDGTLTEAGKKRRQKLRNELNELEKNDKKKKKKDKKKEPSVKAMSDAELAEKTRRAKAEKEYEQAILSKNSRDNAKKYKSVKELTDSELASLVKRLENEDKFNAYKKAHRKLTPLEWLGETTIEVLQDTTKDTIKDIAKTGEKTLTGIIDVYGVELKKDISDEIKDDFESLRKSKKAESDLLSAAKKEQANRSSR